MEILDPARAQTTGAYRVLHAARAGTRAMTPEVLWAIPRVGAPVPSPGGHHLAVPVTTHDVQANRGTSRLWLVPTDGGAPRALTAPERHASQPAFAPDGTRLAFVARSADDPKAAAQLHVLPLTGGEAERITDMPLSVFDPQWLPDGSGLVFGAWLFEEHPQVEATRAEAARRKDEPYTVHATEDRMYRFWDQWVAGGVLGRYFLLDFATDTIRDLMPTSTLWFNWMDPAGAFDIAPDGREIVFHAFRVGGAAQRFRSDVYRLSLTEGGAEPECLTGEHPASSVRPRYTPCGGAVLYGRKEDPDFYADRERLIHLSRTTLQHEPWLATWDRAPGSWVFGEGTMLWFHAEDDGSQPIWSLEMKRARMGPVEPTAAVRGGMCSAPRPAADGFVYFSRQDVSSPAEVWRVSQAGGAAERVTRFTEEAMADVALGEVRDYRFTGARGATVQAVVVMPPDAPGKPLPLVHMIHGGPHGQFGDLWHYRWNTHAFAQPGYAVACVNFQGSTSWGNDFAQRIQGAWGDRPLGDVMAATDLLIDEGVADAARLAISGGSYGGYLTCWIATQTNRFACAVNHAGVFDLPLQYASDVTWGRARNMGGEIWIDPASVDRYNPARHTAGFNTPMLVIHGEKDYRVPINQALECYGILKAKGVEARLVYFADENHWILKPKNSLRWYDEVLGWFARFLGAAP